MSAIGQSAVSREKSKPVRLTGVGYNPGTPSGSRVARFGRLRRTSSVGVDSGVPEKDDQLFLKSLPAIDGAVTYVCRRHRLSADEADDFSSEVRVHFIERNYEPLRRFEGRSTLRTYLITVVNHLFLDYRNRLWGKWRPSAEASRIGPVAIQFERLVIRDGWSVEQAKELLLTNHRVAPEDLATLGR